MGRQIQTATEHQQSDAPPWELTWDDAVAIGVFLGFFMALVLIEPWFIPVESDYVAYIAAQPVLP